MDIFFRCCKSESFVEEGALDVASLVEEASPCMRIQEAVACKDVGESATEQHASCTSEDMVASDTQSTDAGTTMSISDIDSDSTVHATLSDQASENELQSPDSYTSTSVCETSAASLPTKSCMSDADRAHPLSKDNGIAPIQPRWWSEAKMDEVKGMNNSIAITRLRDARVVKHVANPKNAAPWQPAQSAQLYKEMGMDVPGQCFLSLWLNVGASSLVLACDVVDKVLLEQCLATDALGKRMKLILNPVQVKLPFPAKGPKDADTVGSFFGKSASLNRCQTSCGGEVVTVQIDLYAKWILKMALKNVGFRTGNVVELILVDWAGPKQKPGVLAACRLSVTEEYMNLVA